jgi:putative phosphoesterase
MKKIVLISDTHSYVNEDYLKYAAECDEIWHAGDIGSLDVTDALQSLAPLRAVYGNIDNKYIQKAFPKDNIFEVEGFTVWITHIGGYPGKYLREVNQRLKTFVPDIFICGHSHILRVISDKNHKNMLCLNPGAAGMEGFHQIRTILRFTLSDKKITDMQAIELGKRKKL